MYWLDEKENYEISSDVFPQFQCDCCQTDIGTVQDTLPDVCIAYKLHLECGRLINLYDWFQVGGLFYPCSTNFCFCFEGSLKIMGAALSNPWLTSETKSNVLFSLWCKEICWKVIVHLILSVLFSRHFQTSASLHRFEFFLCRC